jgi:hypothetical protein
MNHPNKAIRMVALLAMFTGIATAHAAVSSEEAKQLGGPVLTAFGSEKAGNNEGTIPPYTGSGAKAPPEWDPKKPGPRFDPYHDKPLFSITAQNAAQYADKLDGMTEVFKKYPNFRMDIYSTHRDVVFPQYVLDNDLKNATSCKAVDNEQKLQGCYGGLPFPIPKTGNQAMWNHLVSYHVISNRGRAEAWIIPPSGAPALVSRGVFLNNWPYYDQDRPGPRAADELYWRYLGKDEEPARAAGGQIMILDPVDQLTYGRRAYVYVTGRRWAKLSANLSYDTPSPYSGASATMDDSRVFLGALDRFDFELVGKKEKFIYYNTYQLSNEQTCPKDKYLASKGFPDPDCIRWELHRVWVVKATLKPGASHLYKTRMFYWDEDGYNAGMSESYDANGKLFRYAFNIYYPFYSGEAAGGFGGSSIFMDLGIGLWASSGAQNCKDCGWTEINMPLPKNTFDPDAMSGAGIR